MLQTTAVLHNLLVPFQAARHSTRRRREQIATVRTVYLSELVCEIFCSGAFAKGATLSDSGE